MKRLASLVLMVAFAGCGSDHTQQTGPTGKWKLSVESQDQTTTFITLDGTFIRTGNTVTAQNGSFSGIGNFSHPSLCLFPYPAFFSNGIVATNQFSGAFAVTSTPFPPSEVITFSATLASGGKSLKGTFNTSGGDICFDTSGIGVIVGSQVQ
jgi:hypothetical protein